MIRAALGFVLFSLVLATGTARAAVPSLYLVQNSGWMEPFFTDPSSPFKPLLRALVDASQTGRTIIATFNQDGEVPGHRSPEVAFDAPYAPRPVQAAIDGLTLATRPGRDGGGTRLTDADFNGALVRSLDEILDGKPGIVWVLTNNKNSRNNSPEVDRNTRDFAELIRSSPFLPFVAAYPVRMPVTGRLFTERGLIIYAIAYGDAAGAALSRIVDSAPMRALFTDPPVRLKHLDQAPLVFSATGADAGVVAQPGGGVLLRGVPASGGVVRVTGTLRSDYYPETIVGADATLAWSALGGVADPAALPAQVLPGTLARLPAGGQQTVTLVLRLPAVARPPGLAGVFAETKVLTGSLQLRLSDMTMALGSDFVAKMSDIAALDQLPDVFADYQTVRTATAVIPVTLAVQYSPLPLIVALCGAAAVVIGLPLLLLVVLRPRRYSVAVDGRGQVFTLRPFQSRTVALRTGQRLVVTGRVFGAARRRVTGKAGGERAAD